MHPPAHPANVNTDNGTPEDAINGFLKKIQKDLSHMSIPAHRSKLYAEEIESLSNLYRPNVTVAICGATGAGKSSLLNAILNVDIVPTSSVRACTAVVTQISWNKESEKIVAEVEFLTRAEWTDELVALLSDLVDPTCEHVTHANKLVGPGATAWAKIHAVYPGISFQELTNMDADMFMQEFPHISELLGTSAHIEVSDVKQFRLELKPYLDSREHQNHQALWPLIRHVKIFCRSAALSTGITLVDLPGTADTNAARDKVAKDYLKDCDHCWIVSPITRAISDRVASELLGHMFRLQLKLDGKLSSGVGVTFVATKNEDINPLEVVKNLDLEDDAQFQCLTANLTHCRQMLVHWNDGLRVVNTDRESIRRRIAEATTKLNEYSQDLSVLLASDGRKAIHSHDDDLLQSTLKRKYGSIFSVQEQEGPTKRKREHANDPRVVAIQALNPELSETGQDNVINQGPSPSSGISGMSVEELESSIHDAEQNIQRLNKELFGISEYREAITRRRGQALKDQKGAEKDIRAFCATQRAEYSRHRLREDFRINLEECAGDEIGQEDLPVFIVSSWDYMSLQDNKPSACFNDVAETEIPALQDWCHALTLPARNDNARILATQFRAFALVLKTFLEGAEGITKQDRNKMWQTWGSRPLQPAELWLYSRGRGARRSATPSSEDLQGISSRLLKSFRAIVEDTTGDLQSRFTEYLQDDCDEGAISAAQTAVDTSKDFAQMKWQKYRAFLRRNGCYEGYDLNTELTVPFVSHISRNWCRLFQSNLFDAFETATIQAVEELVDQVVQSVPEYLTSRAKKQGEVALERTRAFLVKSVTTVQRTLDLQQRAISRRLAPHVEGQLEEGYQEALCIQGPGTTPLQKEAVHAYIDKRKDEVFCGAADVLMGGLNDAAEAIGEALEDSLTTLSMTVESAIAVLWEGPLEDDTGVKTRVELMRFLDDAITQADDWLKKYNQQPRLHGLAPVSAS